ncbi:MAG: lytic transglycosylase domain-containing protein [Deltaproteobacteria bacterium]|nr:lytic transglycosylase domain-containing protein [Deltaproteobacteria bacterium]
MTWRLFVVTLLMITVFILALSSFTDEGSERSTIAQRSLKDQGVEGSAVNAPISFSEALFRISWGYGIPPKLVQAIIQVESQGNPKAISPAGALGLMQLMPEVIKACEVADPFDPLANILAGVRHLNYLLLEFSGNLSLALAAYNAGPGTVRRYGGIPPFPETWNYVHSVLREYQGVGNELEMFMQPLEVKMKSIQNIYEKKYPVRGSKELFTFMHQGADHRTLQAFPDEKEYDFKK